MTKKNVGARAFGRAAPYLLNSLPAQIQSIADLSASNTAPKNLPLQTILGS